jgi:hypothetical protein
MRCITDAGQLRQRTEGAAQGGAEQRGILGIEAAGGDPGGKPRPRNSTGSSWPRMWGSIVPSSYVPDWWKSVKVFTTLLKAPTNRTLATANATKPPKPTVSTQAIGSRRR